MESNEDRAKELREILDTLSHSKSGKVLRASVAALRDLGTIL